MLRSAFLKVDDYAALFGALFDACAACPDWTAPKVELQFVPPFFSAEYCGSSFDGRGLYAAMVYWESDPRRVRVTMHAPEWGNHRPFATEGQYLAAEQLTTTLFAVAGRILGRRLRLSHAPSDRPRPLRGDLERALRAVTVFCQGKGPGREELRELHPSDEESFWWFIRTAHRYVSTLRPSDVEFHLKQAGLADSLAEKLSEQYRVARQVLALKRNPWDLRVERRAARRRRAIRDAEERRMEREALAQLRQSWAQQGDSQQSQSQRAEHALDEASDVAGSN